MKLKKIMIKILFNNKNENEEKKNDNIIINEEKKDNIIINDEKRKDSIDGVGDFMEEKKDNFTVENIINNNNQKYINFIFYENNKNNIINTNSIDKNGKNNSKNKPEKYSDIEDLVNFSANLQKIKKIKPKISEAFLERLKLIN